MERTSELNCVEAVLSSVRIRNINFEEFSSRYITWHNIDISSIDLKTLNNGSQIKIAIFKCFVSED